MCNAGYHTANSNNKIWPAYERKLVVPKLYATAINAKANTNDLSKKNAYIIYVYTQFERRN